MGAGGQSPKTDDEIREARGERYVAQVQQRVAPYDQGLLDGIFDGYQQDLFVFDPETLVWTRVSEVHGQMAIAKCWAFACTGRVFIGGGYGLTQQSKHATHKVDEQTLRQSFQRMGLDASEVPGGLYATPQCVVAISKVAISLLAADGHDHMTLRNTLEPGLKNEAWATAPLEADVPDFDIGFGRGDERSFLIFVVGSAKHDAGQYLNTHTMMGSDEYKGPLCARRLAVLNKRQMVEWSVLKDELLCAPPSSSRRDGMPVAIGHITMNDIGQSGEDQVDSWAVNLLKATYQHNAWFAANARRLVVRNVALSRSSSHGQLKRQVQVEWLKGRCVEASQRNSRVLAALKASRSRAMQSYVIDVALTQLVPPVWRRL